MIREKSFRVRPFSLASLVAAAGLCLSLPALGTHSPTTTTTSGTSICKLCTHITWEFEAGDLSVEYVGLTETTPWTSGTIKYLTDEPSRTIKGRVCFDATQAALPDEQQPECATAEFRILDDGLVCTGYAPKSCEREGRRDSLKTFTQACGAPTNNTTADCVGRLEATTAATSPKGQIVIREGDGITIGGAVEAAQRNDCTTIFKNESGAFSTKEMGRIVQKHYNSTNCNASDKNDIVDVSHNQRACSSPFGVGPGTCYNDQLVAQPPRLAFTQEFLPVATGTCLPGTVQSGCTTDRDSGKFRQVVTGLELAKLGVDPNQVVVSSFKCGDPKTGIAPESVTPTNVDGDALTDYDVRCRTCTTGGVFLCAGGQCYLTGTDGAQQFASACTVILQ